MNGKINNLIDEFIINNPNVLDVFYNGENPICDNYMCVDCPYANNEDVLCYMCRFMECLTEKEKRDRYNICGNLIRERLLCSKYKKINI